MRERVEKLLHGKGLRQSEPPEAPLSRGSAEIFISWLKGSWPCLHAIGPFMGSTSAPAQGHRRGVVHAPFPFPIILEVWHMAEHPIRAWLVYRSHTRLR